LQFIKMITKNSHFKVNTTVNPVAFDMTSPDPRLCDQKMLEKQSEIVSILLKAGAGESFTCTPYLIGNSPASGCHVAWGESSAVTFLNSVLGAKSNREGGPSALAAAIIGKTPLYGLHLIEERKASVRITLEIVPRETSHYSLLGYTVGVLLRKGIPYVEFSKTPCLSELKAFCAGLAAASNISMSIIKGVTPPGTYRENPLMERVHIEENDLENALQKFSESERNIDFVFLGCPHYSLDEIMYLAELTEGRKALVEVMVSTSRYIYRKALKLGIIDILEKRGVKIIRDTCAIVAPLKRMDIRSVATDSAKAAHYLRLKHGMRVRLMSVREIATEFFR